MKKNYVKPCSSCMLVVAEQAMLAGSLGMNNQNLDRASHTTLGPSTAGRAKEDPFEYDEE